MFGIGANGIAVVGCQKTSAPSAPATADVKPTLRIHVVSSLAGAMEPCGCVKDMLGGLDHAAALLRQSEKGAESSLMLAAGPMFFRAPKLEAARRQQDVWKAQSIADSFADLDLVAWAPGVNDFAGGLSTLASLQQSSRAALLAANLTGPGIQSTQIIDRGGLRVGLTGISALGETDLPEGVSSSDPKAALVQARKALKAGGAKVLIALLAMKRGEALRLVESVPGFHVFVLGKQLDRGEANDAPLPAVRVGNTVVVQPPNHLQALSVLDLFVRDGKMTFQDAAGLDQAEQKQSIERRQSILEKRIARWKSNGAVTGNDLAARELELAQLKTQLGKMASPVAPKSGSFFRYELAMVRESSGMDKAVAARMSDYYQRVNNHNREAFADRKPEPVADGHSSYAGISACNQCHEEAVTFWKTTSHARAYETLSRDHKQFNLDCVSCHVTGYEKPGGSTVTFVDQLKDVQCEVCHGPLSRHAAEPDSQEPVRPPQSLCSKCHHEPHVGRDWKVRQAWPHILGPGHGR